MPARKKKRASRPQSRARRSTSSKSRAVAKRRTAPKSRALAKRRAAPKSKARAKAPRRPSKAAKRPASARASAPRARTRAPARAASAPLVTSAVPNGVGLQMQHMDYTSQDLESLRRFYVDALGFRDFDLDPATNYLMVRTGASSSLGFMPPMPGPPEEWRPPREPAIYLIVQDVDRAHRALLDKNVVFDQPPETMPWGHRVALLRDPEGRRVCLAQILEKNS